MAVKFCVAALVLCIPRQVCGAVAAVNAAVGGALSQIGFEVISGENLGRRALLARLDEVAQRLDTGDTVFFFFSGHGVAVDGANYIARRRACRGERSDREPHSGAASRGGGHPDPAAAHRRPGRSDGARRLPQQSVRLVRGLRAWREGGRGSQGSEQWLDTGPV
jgi:hypothetical protein